jgi:hypothetical protein
LRKNNEATVPITVPITHKMLSKVIDFCNHHFPNFIESAERSENDDDSDDEFAKQKKNLIELTHWGYWLL